MHNSLTSLIDIRPQEIEQDVVSFDLFDTLIYRRYLRFNEVHDLASAYALAAIGQYGQLRPADLTQARYATTDGLKMAPENPVEEPSLALVWSRLLASRLGPEPRAEALAARVAQFEYEIDCQNLAIVDGAAELLEACKASGKRIIAVTDMYFSGGEIRSLLAKLGILHYFERVFVSSEEGLTKQTGRIFGRVFDALGISSDRLIHFGDNFTSDVAMPRSFGAEARHIDQHAALHVEEQYFGRRDDIHREIADLNKLFLARIKFNALNDDADRIYFMSRDGCLVHRVLDAWRSPILNNYFGDIPSEDLFLSRAVSCWLNVNFQGKWLLQAIGHAFWLHHGDATPRQISTILGIEAVPDDLADRPYNHAVDTFTVLEAYERAGLSEPIREALLAKRRNAWRYLDDCGFLGRRSVAICDIGYSGTVPRDLNTFFLQSAAADPSQTIPRIVFHSIASNGNYARNAVAAQPHVRFLDRVILPVSEMPDSLSDSFAWLEMFFKHPTYGPLRGYCETDGRMVPDYHEADHVAAGHPAEHIIAHSIARPQDIVILWMAAVEAWDGFTEALLARFADPDAQTVDQMMADIYEVDAVTGTTRSVVMLAPELSDKELYAVAKSRDYWIPGTIAASRALRTIQTDWAGEANVRLAALSSAKSHGALAGLMRRFLRSDKSSRDFDPDFYRASYADMRLIDDDEALAEHYRQHGRLLGRYGSQMEFDRRTSAEFGPLPIDFEYGAYLVQNPDILPHDPARWDAELHYLRHGRRAKRAYLPAWPNLDSEFDALVGSGKLRFDEKEQAAWADGVPARTLLFRRHGIGAGPWLDQINVAEFVALNFEWCGKLHTLAEVVLMFLDRGLDRIAPLSLGIAFDPAFYRSQHRTLARLDDVELYRHWLATGSLRGFAPSEAYRLEFLIGNRTFPACFDWESFQRYAMKNADGDVSRVEVLENFLDLGDPANGHPMSGAGADALWSAMGRRAGEKKKYERAYKAYQRAIEAGAPLGHAWHRIGDLLVQEKRHVEAVKAYASAIEAPSPSRWSYINAADAAGEIAAFDTGLRFIEAGARVWKQMEPWRQARERLFQRWFDAEIALKADEVASAETAECLTRVQRRISHIVDAMARTLPPSPSVGRHDGPVVILSGGSLEHRSAVEVRARTRGDGAVMLAREDIALFRESLIGAAMAILHDVQLDSFVIDVVLQARSYGVPIIFWAGQPGSIALEDGVLDLSKFVVSDFMRIGQDPPPGLSHRTLLAAMLCDGCVSGSPALAPALSLIAKPGQLAISRHEIINRVPATFEADRRPRCVLASGSEVVGAAVQRALADMLRRYPAMNLILDGVEPREPSLRAQSARISVLRTVPDLDQRLALANAVDLIIDMPDAEGALRSWWADAAAYGVPAILGSGALPAEVLSGTASLRIASADDLVEAVERLLEDGALRMSIGEAARTQLAAYPNRLAIRRANAERSIVSGRRTILYANLFAPPQITGGATRVLSDNLGTMIELAGDRYDVAILASDDDNARRGTIHCDLWQGKPVFRIATPQEIDMDWRTFNAEVAGFAERVFALSKPDLVHIHCLPRLTVAVAEACQVAGIPYIVTLHDAWWLSDYPFLVDDQGVAVEVDADPLLQPWSKRIGLARSLERASRFRSALIRAEALLSVSEPFAAVYRNAGFTVQTVANGVSHLPQVERVAGKGRVRLGHIGGIQHHKGAFLIESLLRTHRFENLDFTIVELARDVGDVIHTVWGNTPVTIRGKTPADQVGGLYGQLDVLLAPSIWPESFGLVSREALASGLWVVASDRGGMAEDVVPGENGFVIDVDTPEGLLHALKAIDADPVRYLTPPLIRPELRTADAQGMELIALYDRLLDARDALRPH